MKPRKTPTKYASLDIRSLQTEMHVLSGNFTPKTRGAFGCSAFNRAKKKAEAEAERSAKVPFAAIGY